MTKYLSLIIFSIFCASTSLAQQFAVVHIVYYSEEGSFLSIKDHIKKAGHSALAFVEVPLPFSDALDGRSNGLDTYLTKKWVELRDAGKITYVSHPYGYFARSLFSKEMTWGKLLIQNKDESEALNEKISKADPNDKFEIRAARADIAKYQKYEMQSLGLINGKQLRDVEALMSKLGIVTIAMTQGFINKYFVEDLQAKAIGRDAHLFSTLRSKLFANNARGVDPLFRRTTEFILNNPSRDWSTFLNDKNAGKQLSELQISVLNQLEAEFPRLSEEEYEALNNTGSTLFDRHFFLTNNCSVRSTECIAVAFGLALNGFLQTGPARIWRGMGFSQTPGLLSKKIDELGEKGLLNASETVRGERDNFLRDLTQLVSAAGDVHSKKLEEPNAEESGIGWSILSILSAFPNEMGGVDDDE